VDLFAAPLVVGFWDVAVPVEGFTNVIERSHRWWFERRELCWGFFFVFSRAYWHLWL